MQKFNGIVDEYLTLFLDTAQIATQCVKDKVDEDFMYAYVAIGSRWFSHIESINYLLHFGYYGDVAALSRIIIGDINLISYFRYFPEDISEWRKLTDYMPRNKDEPKEIKELRQYFLDGEIRKRLSKKQMPLDDKGALSQAVHATDWGMRFYTLKNYSKGQAIINYGSMYEPGTAFKMWCLLLAFIRSPSDTFISRSQDIKLNASGIEEVKSKHSFLTKKWKKQTDRLKIVGERLASVEAKVC